MDILSKTKQNSIIIDFTLNGDVADNLLHANPSYYDMKVEILQITTNGLTNINHFRYIAEIIDIDKNREF